MQHIKKIIYICALWCTSALLLHAQVTATVKQVQNGQGGSITLQITGGNAPFSFNWSYTEPIKGLTNTSYSTDQDIFNLKPGEYCVEISDANCCTAEQCFTIREECKNIFVAYKKNESSCGDGKTTPSSDGEIKVGVGLPFTESDYDFEWTYLSTPAWVLSTTSLLIHCTATNGDYVLKAKNKKNGCEEKLQVKICCCSDGGSLINFQKCDNSEDEPLTVIHKATPPTSGKSNGKIVLTTKGGGGSIYYKWTGPNGFTSNYATISGLAKGEYCYTVTNGCFDRKDCITIYTCGDNPMKLTEKIAKPCTYVNKEKGIDKTKTGAIDLTVSGGVTPYKFLWSNGKTTQSIANLPSGTYSVTVTDEGGCTAVKSIFVDYDVPYPNKSDPTNCKVGIECGGVSVENYDYGYSCNTLWEENCTYYVCKCNEDGKILKEKDGTTKKIDAPIHVCFNREQCKLEVWCESGKKFGTYFGNSFEKTETGIDAITGKDICCRVTYCNIKGNLFVVDVKQGDIKSTASYITLDQEGDCNVSVDCYDGVNIGGIHIRKFLSKGCDFTAPPEADCFSVFEIPPPCWDEFSNPTDESNFKSEKSFDRSRIISDPDKIFEYFQKDFVSVKIVFSSPNPFYDYIDLSVFSGAEQNLTILMEDIFGNPILKREVKAELGINKIQLESLGELKDGTLYSIYIFDDKGNSTHSKVIKAN